MERVRIPPSRNGRGGNYGFITFSHSCSVDYALNVLDGTCLYGQKLNMKPRKPLAYKCDDPFATSRDDFIRGVDLYRGTNNSTFNSPLANPYNHSAYIDKSMLPTSGSNKRTYDQFSPSYNSFDDDKVKSVINQVSPVPGLNYAAFMNLGQQMFAMSQMLPSPLLNSVQNSYYGTPVQQFEQNNSNGRDSYRSNNRQRHRSNHRRSNEGRNRRH